MNFTVDSTLQTNIASICKSQSQISNTIQFPFLQIYQSNHIQLMQYLKYHLIQRCCLLFLIHLVSQKTIFYYQLNWNPVNFLKNWYACWQFIQFMHLIGFYVTAVLLRFQYPMMIVTKTKDIFLKRLKRNKKIITEQGSSDQSKSNTLSRSIQLHTNTFLDSVNSSQLSKRTAQLRDQLFPQFRQKKNNDKSYDMSIHDIHNPIPSFDNSIVQKREFILEDQSFADKLMKLSKNISLNEMIDSQAVQVNLSPVQTDINYLICDFDQIDKQITMQNYEKLRIRDKQNRNIQHSCVGLSNKQDEFINVNGQRFRKKSKMIITPIDENGNYLNHEKTLQNPKYKRVPKQMQYSAMQRQLKGRNNNYHQNNNYLVPSQNRMYPKMSAFYQTTKNSLMMNSQQDNQHEESYKTLQRFRTGHIQQKANEHQLKYVYHTNSNNNDGYNRGRTNSYQQNCLPRHRSNNVINLKRQTSQQHLQYDNGIHNEINNGIITGLNNGQNSNNRRKQYNGYIQQQQQTDPYNRKQQQLQQQSYTHNRVNNQQRYSNNVRQGGYRYSVKNNKNNIKQSMNGEYRNTTINDEYITQFDPLSIDGNNIRLNSPRFAQLKQEQQKQQDSSKFSIYSKHNNNQKDNLIGRYNNRDNVINQNNNRLTTQTKVSHLPITTQKYYISALSNNINQNIQSNISPPHLPPPSHLSPHLYSTRQSGQIHSNQSNQVQINPSTLLVSHNNQGVNNIQDKQQKKKRIRQKAAQLLSRVKSHQYLTNKNQYIGLPYQKRY